MGGQYYTFLYMSTNRTIYHVDAFTAEPFRGNPAGVCILEKEMPEKWMQNIAMEMNLSETAFLIADKDYFRIRFFTPQAEIPLCGHATLSSAHILFEQGFVRLDQKIRLESKAGELVIFKSGSWITMNFPTYDLEPVKIPEIMKDILGLLPKEMYKTGHGWTFLLLDSEKSVRGLNPDFRLMKNSGYGDMIVTAKSDDIRYDFCLRCFAPALGIDEDPVTGSAHCALVPFWNKKTGKTDFISHQVSRREGILKVSLKEKRVEISGEARTIIKGELFV